MAILPGSDEYNLFLILTVILLFVKIVLATYLLMDILRRKKKEGNKVRIDFIFAIFIFMLCLIISRIFYFIFDFQLTYFDSETYYLFPNYIFWKIGMVISNLGFAFVIFVIDEKALKFKFKGIFSYIPLAILAVIAFFPVNSSADFNLLSLLGLFAVLSGALLIFLFLYIGIKIKPLRKTSFIITFGFLIYALGPLLINEFILETLRVILGPQIHVLLYLAYLILKITGLILISYSIRNFKI